MIKKHLFFVAVYLRLSREDSASEADTDFDGSSKAESNSISSQREMIRSYVREQEDMELFDIYVDDGYSGANFVEVR